MGKSPFTETGLWEGEGTIVDAHFGHPEWANEFSSDSQFLMLDIETDDANLTEPVQETWSVGGAWVSNDGGDTIANPQNPSKLKVNMQSQYGGFIDHAWEGSGGLDGPIHKLLTEQGMLRADVWKGLRFRFERVAKERNIRGEKTVSEKLMPVEYLGVEGNPTSSPSATSSSATTNGLSEDAQAELKVIAMASADHNAFVDAAMQSKAVEADRNLVREIAKPALFESLKS